jgi:hypothetical protein
MILASAVNDVKAEILWMRRGMTKTNTTISV